MTASPSIISASSAKELRKQLRESGLSEEDFDVVGDGSMTVYLHSKRGADILRHHFVRDDDRVALGKFKPGPSSLRFRFTLAMNRAVHFLFR